MLDSDNPYITVVVATVLSGPNSGVGRSNLQGAYIAQKEYNECADAPPQQGKQCRSLGPNWHVRLLIANSGSLKEDAVFVANQIIQLSKVDTTFVGVMGWPLSDQTLQALKVLKTTNIPMVSSASSKELLILCTVPQQDGSGTFHMAQAQGQFLVRAEGQPPHPSFTTECK